MAATRPRCSVGRPRWTSAVAIGAGVMLAAVAGIGERASGGGPITDCNANGIDDATDIAAGTSLDCDGNGVPDECQVFLATPITSRRLASQLNEPVGIAFAPGDGDRLFIVEQLGRIKILDLVTGAVNLEPFLDIAPIVRPIGEQGLLSMAFHPDYATNGRFYVAYVDQPQQDLHLVEYTVAADPDVADPGTAIEVVALVDFIGHNGGQLQFGPDDLLYFGTGDGSTASEMDVLNNAQNLESLFGKILRYDVDNPPTYIPASNPYVGDPDAFDAIWARGLRNPWRFGFDRLTGDLYIGDVGKTQKEEIDFQPAGASPLNYGWRCMEGTLCTGLVGCTCNDPGLTLPIHEEQHDLGDGTCAIIGGYVYRGCRMPDLDGRYFYADFCGSYLRSFVFDPGSGVVSGAADHTADLVSGFPSPTGFGEDPDGELYYAGIRGEIWKILPVADFDCNGNAVSDRVDIAAATSQDCNANDTPDECDIAAGTSTDCDRDGIPDECQFGTPVQLASPALAPIGTTAPQTHVFASPPAARNIVTFTVVATADVNSDHEWIDVELNGARVGTVLQTTGGNCPAVANTGVFTVSAAVYDTLLAGGDAEVTLVTSVNVSTGECPTSSATVTIDYQRLDPVFDFDGNGIADVCECVADTDGSGTVDVGDLLDVLADWGPCPGCPSDLNHDGNVNVVDLLKVLADWGGC